jgi:hypothetical protein
MEGRLKKMRDFFYRTQSRRTGRKPSRIRIWSRILVLAGLGTMVLTGLCLLPGCGSDSTPGGSVKGKDAKTASLGAKKSGGAISLLADKDKEGMDPGKMGQIKPQPESRRIEVFPGMTTDEMEAKAAAEQKKFVAMDNEVAPGITKKELEAKIAADREKFLSQPQEIFPGITQEELKAKIAADREKFLSQPQEIFPGITQEELKAKIAADREKFLSQPQEIFRGITLAELKARQAAEKSPDPKLMMQTFPGGKH